VRGFKRHAWILQEASGDRRGDAGGLVLQPVTWVIATTMATSSYRQIKRDDCALDGEKDIPDELENSITNTSDQRNLSYRGRARSRGGRGPGLRLPQEDEPVELSRTIALAIEDLAKELPPYQRITGLKIFKEPLPAPASASSKEAR